MKTKTTLTMQILVIITVLTSIPLQLLFWIVIINNGDPEKMLEALSDLFSSSLKD